MAKVCGIYGIQNTVTGEWYVGQSTNAKNRMGFHFSELRRGIHFCRKLQEDYDKLGASAFTRVVLEECEKEKLDETERKWIEEKDAVHNGYNQSFGGQGTLGVVRTEALREHMRTLMSGVNNPNYGKRLSEDQRKRLSENRRGEKCYWYGKQRSQEVKDAISRKNKGKPPVNQKHIYCVETGAVFASIKQAADFLGVSRASVFVACKNHTPSGGFHWAYCEEVAS